LDDNKNALNGFKGYPEVIDGVAAYKLCQDDVFALAIGENNSRKKCISIIKEKGGEFLTLVHPAAYVYCKENLGEGCVVTPLASIGVDVKVGDFCIIQGGAMIGHDAVIGNNVRIDCNVVCVGGIHIGNDVCIHTSAIINHGVTVGDESTVGAMSFVIRNVKPGTTVFGCPAKRLD
jgi:sugar O-acyltransferase (sialic acid O-acetyltransferase NeuD family)